MKENKITLIGLLLSIFFWLIIVFFELDLFEIFLDLLERLEVYEIDEVFLPLGLFLMFAFYDQSRKQQLQKIEIEKNNIYKAMLHSTHHVLNNFLNQMLLFRMEAEDVPSFPPEALDSYDNIMEDAKAQIEALGNVEIIDAASIISSVAPKP